MWQRPTLESMWGDVRSALRICASLPDSRLPRSYHLHWASAQTLGLPAIGVLAHVVYQATPRDLLVLAGVVLATLLVGLVATWIPAQRALGGRSDDPAARGMSASRMPATEIPQGLKPGQFEELFRHG